MSFIHLRLISEQAEKRMKEGFKGHSTCDCRRCKPSGDSADDYCFEIAYSIDENGNYHDDEGNFRDGQTGEIIEEVSA